MSDLPTRDSLKRAGVTLNDAAPVLREYVRGNLKTEAEWRETKRLDWLDLRGVSDDD